MKFIMLFFCMFAGIVQAADYTCSGKVKNLNQNKDGTVSLISPDIYGSNIGRKICSLNENWRAVTPQVCNAWLSKLLMAKASGASIVVQYVDSASCTTQPDWSGANAPTAFWEGE